MRKDLMSEQMHFLNKKKIYLFFQNNKINKVMKYMLIFYINNIKFLYVIERYKILMLVPCLCHYMIGLSDHITVNTSKSDVPSTASTVLYITIKITS